MLAIRRPQASHAANLKQVVVGASQAASSFAVLLTALDVGGFSLPRLGNLLMLTQLLTLGYLIGVQLGDIAAVGVSMFLSVARVTKRASVAMVAAIDAVRMAQMVGGLHGMGAQHALAVGRAARTVASDLKGIEGEAERVLVAAARAYENDVVAALQGGMVGPTAHLTPQLRTALRLASTDVGSK